MSQNAWVYTNAEGLSLLDAPIFFSADKLKQTDLCLPQQATLGYVIYLDGQPFRLTVPHPLMEETHSTEQPTLQNTVIYMDVSDDDDLEECSSTFNSTNAPCIAQDEHLVRPQRLGGSPKLLGQLKYSSAGTPSDDVDWALLSLDEYNYKPTQQLLGLATLGTYTDGNGQTTVVPALRNIASPQKNPIPVFITNGQQRLIKGELSPNKSLLCLGGTQKQMKLHSVILTEGLVSGGCGRWVFDDKGNWYGHIVAALPGTKLVYIALASQIVEDIKIRCQVTSISLHDPQIKELPKST